MKTVNPSTVLRVNGERSRTIKFYTLGCKVNQYDTQSIRERFLQGGFKEIYNGRKAAVYLINTCTVTSIADRKSKSIIRHCIRENPEAKLIVTGCLIEKDPASISCIKGIDFIISKRFFAEGISYFCGHTRAFLKIQDGCNNFCSYCKVPLVRGASRSKPLNEIIQEARQLVKNGFKEIVLSGICLGSYGMDLSRKITLIDVIEGLENIDGLLRIRLSSIEAGDVTDKLMHKMAGSKKLCRHLHIPIQSGDDQILKKMNRKYRREDYLKLIRSLKKSIPQIAITTDCLVGFPGESETNFQNTLDLIKEIIPLKVHIFPYSSRPGTSSANNFNNREDPSIVKERILQLENTANHYALIYKKRFLNKNMNVLIEGSIKEKKGFWQGYTDNYIKVSVKSKQNLKNTLIPLKLKELGKNYVLANLR